MKKVKKITKALLSETAVPRSTSAAARRTPNGWVSQAVVTANITHTSINIYRVRTVARQKGITVQGAFWDFEEKNHNSNKS